jgi:hypothetical protein
MSLEATAVIRPSAVTRRRSSARWFYVGMAVFMVAVSVAGFGPSIIDQSRRIAPSTPWSIAHGLLYSAWLFLFLTQATLVATRRVALHQRLGLAGIVLGLGMVASTVALVIAWGRRGYDASGDIARVFSTPPGVASRTPPTADFIEAIFGVLAGPFIWGVLTAAGLWNRRRPEIHKRLMVMSLAFLVDVPLLHLAGVLVSWRPGLQAAAFIASRVVVLAVLVAPAINDKLSSGRIHPVSLWVPLFYIVWELGMVPLVMSTDIWRQCAAWLFL